MGRTDTAVLVEAIRSGDLGRCPGGVRRIERVLRRNVGRELRDPDARDEVVQQAFYKALLNLDQLADPQQLDAWLARIARSCAIDYCRRQGFRRFAPLDDADGCAAAPPADGWIWDEVASLSEDQGTVLRLRYQDELSYDEIAVRLGVAVSTVRGRIYQARLALRRRLDQGIRDDE